MLSVDFDKKKVITTRRIAAGETVGIFKGEVIRPFHPHEDHRRNPNNTFLLSIDGLTCLFIMAEELTEDSTCNFIRKRRKDERWNITPRLQEIEFEFDDIRFMERKIEGVANRNINIGEELIRF